VAILEIELKPVIQEGERRVRVKIKMPQRWTISYWAVPVKFVLARKEVGPEGEKIAELKEYFTEIVFPKKPTRAEIEEAFRKLQPLLYKRILAKFPGYIVMEASVIPEARPVKQYSAWKKFVVTGLGRELSLEVHPPITFKKLFRPETLMRFALWLLTAVKPGFFYFKREGDILRITLEAKKPESEAVVSLEDLFRKLIIPIERERSKMLHEIEELARLVQRQREAYRKITALTGPQKELEEKIRELEQKLEELRERYRKKEWLHRALDYLEELFAKYTPPPYLLEHYIGDIELLYKLLKYLREVQAVAQAKIPDVATYIARRLAERIRAGELELEGEKRRKRIEMLREITSMLRELGAEEREVARLEELVRAFEKLKI